jgi:hypothetical protein
MMAGELTRILRAAIAPPRDKPDNRVDKAARRAGGVCCTMENRVAGIASAKAAWAGPLELPSPSAVRIF